MLKLNTSNEDLWKETDELLIHTEIRKHKWKWIGHILRKPDGLIETWFTVEPPRR